MFVCCYPPPEALGRMDLILPAVRRSPDLDLVWVNYFFSLEAPSTVFDGALWPVSSSDELAHVERASAISQLQLLFGIFYLHDGALTKKDRLC